MGTDQCFVCGGVLASIVNSSLNWRARKTGASAALLENNLDVIFLLRNLLQVPGIQLEAQLKECGANPEDWISLCYQCTQLIKKARELDEELRKIQKHLKSIQNKVLDKIRAGDLRTTDFDTLDANEKAYRGNSAGNFESNIRSFVKNRKKK